jgi:hypothetical protein
VLPPQKAFFIGFHKTGTGSTAPRPRVCAGHRVSPWTSPPAGAGVPSSLAGRQLHLCRQCQSSPLGRGVEDHAQSRWAVSGLRCRHRGGTQRRSQALARSFPRRFWRSPSECRRPDRAPEKSCFHPPLNQQGKHYFHIVGESVVEAEHHRTLSR